MRRCGLIGSRAVSVASFLALAAVSLGDIRYTVELTSDRSRMKVSMEIPVKGGKELSVQMPRWSPGHYAYEDFGKQINDVVMLDQKGAPVTFTHPDFSTWTVANPPSGKVFVNYSVKADVQNDVLHFAGPATYMYVVDRKDERCIVSIRVPEGWPVISGLMPEPGVLNDYTAPNYDVLADNPISAGKFFGDTYVAAGRLHYIAMRGAPADVVSVDKKQLKNVMKFISEMETNFWSDAPYQHYVWHIVTFPRPDGGFGLEHLSSTQIGLATGLGPGIQGVLSHEFFHLWNVKRVRSKVLGPFNYQELPQTGALWWLEGVTDYYAHLLFRRYGWTDDQRLNSEIASNIRTVTSNEKRLEVSPYEASFRVRDAANGRGNSQGYGISYYNAGFLLGLVFDVAIRDATKGKRSLDDVARALYRKTKNKPGFEEGAIREELVRAGGPSLGTLYDTIVLKPGELPVAEALAKLGLQSSVRDETYAKFPFRYFPVRSRNVYEVRDPSADAGGLKEGDTIVAINGESLEGKDLNALRGVFDAKLGKAEPAKVMEITVKREGAADPIKVSITPVAGTRKVFEVIELPGASDQALAMRKAWLTPPPGWVPPIKE